MLDIALANSIANTPEVGEIFKKDQNQFSEAVNYEMTMQAILREQFLLRHLVNKPDDEIKKELLKKKQVFHKRISFGHHKR